MKYKLVIFLIFCGYLLPVTYIDARSGEKEYREGNFSVSEKKFGSAAESSVEKDPVLFYNLGNSLFKQNKFTEAIDNYEKALASDDKNFRSNVKYNMGNSLFRQKKLEEALSYYKDAVKLDPDNREAAVNYEIVKKIMKQQQQEKQQDQKNQNKDKNEKEQKDQQNQNRDQNKQDQNKQDQNQEQQQNSQQNQQNSQQKEQQSRAEKKKMTKEEAERLLQSLNKDEDDLQKQVKKALINKEKSKVRNKW